MRAWPVAWHRLQSALPAQSHPWLLAVSESTPASARLGASVLFNLAVAVATQPGSGTVLKMSGADSLPAVSVPRPPRPISSSMVASRTRLLGPTQITAWGYPAASVSTSARALARAGRCLDRVALITCFSNPPIIILSNNYSEGSRLFTAQDGTQSIDLTGASNQGANGVQQTINLIAGSYELSFWIGRQGTGAFLYGFGRCTVTNKRCPSGYIQQHAQYPSTRPKLATIYFLPYNFGGTNDDRLPPIPADRRPRRSGIAVAVEVLGAAPELQGQTPPADKRGAAHSEAPAL